MKVVCGYAANTGRDHPGLYPETRAALDRYAPGAVVCDVSGDEEAYYRFLAEHWASGEDLLVVEHDIVLRGGVIDELEACPEPWCGFVHSIGTQYLACLGCTRFRSGLICAAADAVVRAGECRYDPDDPGRVVADGIGARHWVRMDVRLAAVLRDVYGYRVHEHWPPVEHLNPRQRVAETV